MKKKIFIFTFSAVMIFNLSAKEHDFSIGVNFGSLNGQVQEIVYRNSRTDNKLSELLWNFDSLSYIGADIRYSWLKPENKLGIFANGLFKMGVSDGAAKMEDKDWLVDSYPYWLTNYSVHNSRVNSLNMIDLNLGMSILIFQKFLFKPYFSYHYMHFEWSASGGSILYPTVSFDENTGDYYADHFFLGPIMVITYEQTWHIVSPAISFYGEFNRFFDIEIAFEVTPFIWCNSKDDHLQREYGGLVINDYLVEGVFIEPSILFSYKPTDNFVLSLSFVYREIEKTRGDSKYKYKEAGHPVDPEKNIGGAGYYAVDIGIISKFKF